MRMIITYNYYYMQIEHTLFTPRCPNVDADADLDTDLDADADLDAEADADFEDDADLDADADALVPNKLPESLQFRHWFHFTRTLAVQIIQISKQSHLF